MTIVVTVRVTDGIVLAADSATSFADADGHVAKIYNSANKIFNLVKVWPIGAMTYGAGSIGTESISTLSKIYGRASLLNPDLDSANPDQIALDRATYIIENVATKARDFFEERYRAAYAIPVPGYFLGYRVCGYSGQGVLPEAWEIRILEDSCEGPIRIYDDDKFGPRWSGESEALDRLVLGVGSKMADALVSLGADATTVSDTVKELVNRLYANLYLPAMPIQDAIDLARFLVDTAVRFAHFSLRPATVGGPIEIATITKHEGFKRGSTTSRQNTMWRDSHVAKAPKSRLRRMSPKRLDVRKRFIDYQYGQLEGYTAPLPQEPTREVGRNQPLKGSSLGSHISSAREIAARRRSAGARY